MGGQLIDITIKKYLTAKVREKFPTDFHLLEPLMDTLTERYSLKELYIVCSVELARIRQQGEAARVNDSKPDAL